MGAYNSVEFGALVALGLAHGVLGLAGTELAEVLGRPGHYILEELEGDSAERLTCQGVFVRIIIVTTAATTVLISGAAAGGTGAAGMAQARHVTRIKTRRISGWRSRRSREGAVSRVDAITPSLPPRVMSKKTLHVQAAVSPGSSARRRP